MAPLLLLFYLLWLPVFSQITLSLIILCRVRPPPPSHLCDCDVSFPHDLPLPQHDLFLDTASRKERKPRSRSRWLQSAADADAATPRRRRSAIASLAMERGDEGCTLTKKIKEKEVCGGCERECGTSCNRQTLLRVNA